METKIKHYVCPICSGKTTKAQKLQNIDPEGTLLIESTGETDLEFIFNNYIKGNNYKIVIIDNFLKLYCDEKNCVKKFISKLKRYNIEEIILFSTPDKVYNKNTDKKELSEKFLNSKEVNVICETFYSGLSSFDRINLTKILPPEEFQSKILGDLYGVSKSLVIS